MKMHQLMAGLSADKRSALAGYFAKFPEDAQVSLKSYNQGEYIIHQEDKAEKVYVLIQGEVRITIHQPNSAVRTLSVSKAVDFFGEYEALAGYDFYLGGVTAQTDCLFIIMSATQYIEWITADPALVMKHARSVCQKMLKQNAEGESSIYLSGVDRCIMFFVDYYRGNQNPNGDTVTVKETRSAIAQEIGFTVRTVNRAISLLKNSGDITLIHGKVNISKTQYKSMELKLESKLKQ